MDERRADIERVVGVDERDEEVLVHLAGFVAQVLSDAAAAVDLDAVAAFAQGDDHRGCARRVAHALRREREKHRGLGR